MKIIKTLMVVAAFGLTTLPIVAQNQPETNQIEVSAKVENTQEKPDKFTKSKEFPETETLKTTFEREKPKTFNSESSENEVEQPQSTTKPSRFGGHVGFVVPIVARGNGNTTNLGDRFQFGFPVGLTVKTASPFAFDFEFIPFFNTGRDFVLVVHPGIIYGFKKKINVGVRAAYEVNNNDAYGFTPLIAKGFKLNDKVGYFIEADFPVRWNKRPRADRFVSGAFALHFGFNF